MKLSNIPISATRIKKRVKQLAKEINDNYVGKELVVICVMNGAMLFCADLFRELTMKAKLDSIKVSSYKGTISSGRPQFVENLKIDINGKHVLIIDDILDTGNTLSMIYKYLFDKGPASIDTCVLLDKKGRRVTPFEAEYVGFSIPDEFVLGYGLDYNEDFRNLPFVGAKHFPFG